MIKFPHTYPLKKLVPQPITPPWDLMKLCCHRGTQRNEIRAILLVGKTTFVEFRS
jgi:hypothetical protein